MLARRTENGVDVRVDYARCVLQLLCDASGLRRTLRRCGQVNQVGGRAGGEICETFNLRVNVQPRRVYSTDVGLTR